jgi:hypothetical protein
MKMQKKEKYQMANYIKGTKNEILEQMKDTAKVDSPVHEQQKMGIIVRCTEDMEKAIKSLEQSMNKNSEVGNSVAEKICRLNTILTIATIVGVVATLIAAIAALIK